MADFYYDVEGGKRMDLLKQAKPDLYQAFRDFNAKAYAEGVLPAKTKELIALACAHITQCPYCIDGHTQRARKLGSSDEEIAEAVFVAIAIRAGGALAHSTVAMRGGCASLIVDTPGEQVLGLPQRGLSQGGRLWGQ